MQGTLVRPKTQGPLGEGRIRQNQKRSMSILGEATGARDAGEAQNTRPLRGGTYKAKSLGSACRQERRRREEEDEEGGGGGRREEGGKEEGGRKEKAEPSQG